MRTVSRLKGVGYGISTASIALLSVVAWETAEHKPWLMLCLGGGLLLAVAGMVLRWVSHRIEQREKDRIEAKAEGPEPPGRPALARGGRQAEMRGARIARAAARP